MNLRPGSNFVTQSKKKPKSVPRTGAHIVFHFLSKDVNEDPGEDVALLSVSFEDTEATQVYPKLYLSPRIEQ